MRHYIILVLFAIGFCDYGFSQNVAVCIPTSKTDNLQSDSVNTSTNKEFERKAGLKPIDQTQNSYEIRFYKTEELSGIKTLKILHPTKEGWIAKKITDLGDSVKIETLSMKDGQVRAASRLLFGQNLGYLPDQEQLKVKIEKVENLSREQAVKKHLISDGQSYTVEFKDLAVYRIYSFNNPEVYSKLYPNIQEFKDYLSIVNIFETMVK